MDSPKRVLVTGGTGTLGSALIPLLLRWPGVERVVCYSRGEHRQAALAERVSDPRCRWIIGDVRDQDKLERAMWGCDTVVHAAALKRVDAVSFHPDEIVKTNVVGTQNAIEAALAADVDHLLVITSDKGVAPSNAYGASKLMAEFLAVAANIYTYPRGLHISCLRYGNVLGSQGSVVQPLIEAIRGRRLVALTDARMTRFWLTIQGSADLALSCVRHMRGGEVFVPRLPAMTLLDFAKAVATFLALDWPGYSETGFRPGGEKLHEQLVSRHEADRVVQPSPDLFVVEPFYPHWPGGRAPWEGEKVPDGFEYSSDAAPQLSIPAMVAMLRALPIGQRVPGETP